ncbi:MAG: sensor domain-containing protein [Anaerolineales bacterium]|nr:sensor domain-containing protein [Anaerolineales bacterium]
MIKSIEEYLDQLKAELKDSDAATVQDALADAEEHLRVALATLKQDQPETSEEEALGQVIEQYGSPDETASAYKAAERLTHPVIASNSIKSQSILARFFGVYTDARAWGALLYMLIAFVTGIIYFTWAVTGVSVSVSFLIFIFGFPIALLFLLSVRGLALLEGRLVEALLGIRMPRRPLFSHQNMKWLDRLKALVTDKATWLMILYMVIQFVLGIIYFVVLVTVLSFSLTFIALPFIQLFWNTPVVQWNDQHIFLPYWVLVLFSFGGLILWTSFMHLVRGIGQLHGRMAKAMLVS